MTSLEQDLGPDSGLCVHCGAPVSFRGVDDSPLDHVPCEYCNVVNDRATAELRQRRARERHAAREALARRRKVVLGASAAGVVAVVLVIGAALRTQGELSGLLAEIERSDAQLVNVQERQEAVVRQWDNAAPGPDRDAELSGAENRVRIERARRDEAAAAYNARVGAAWPSIVAGIFRLPTHARLSDDPHW